MKQKDVKIELSKSNDHINYVKTIRDMEAANEIIRTNEDLEYRNILLTKNTAKDHVAHKNEINYFD